MACDYKFTASAEQDLDDILYYISQKLDNPIAAGNFMTRLEETITEVIAFPKCGTIVDNDFFATQGHSQASDSKLFVLLQVC